MRTSQSRTGPRLLRAGIAAVATAAAVLAGTATPALATAATLTVSPTAGTNSGTITASSTNFVQGVTAPATIFTTSACPDPYATATTNITATTSKTSDDAVSITVPSTLTLTATTGAAKSYNVCVYNGTVASTSALKGSGTYLLTPVATPTVSTGPSGGGNTLTVNTLAASPVFTATTLTAVFATGPCPAAYGTPAITATATKVSTTQVTVPVPAAVGGPDGTRFAICFYPASASSNSALIAGSSATAYGVTLPSVTLSSTIGPASTTNNPVNLTITGPSTFLTGVTAPAVVVIAGTASCSALYVAPGNANMGAAARKVANNKAAFTMPAGPVVAQSSVSTDYKICLYSSTSTTAGKLLSSSTFTVANQPKITAVLPNSGSALGNSTITVTGSDFPTTAGSITATLGGEALTSITPLGSDSFTAVTPAHAVGSVALTVTTAQGTDTLPNAFTYANSIRISPNTAPSTTTAQDIDVQGSGFLDYTFDQSANVHANVYLVDGVYNATTDANGDKANGPVAVCGNVLVISENELICSLNLTAAMERDGSGVRANGRRTATANVSASDNLITLATGTFNANDVGESIAQANNTNIASGTTILAVLSPTTAVLSADTTSATPSNPITVTIGSQRTVTASGTNGTNTLTGSAGAFTQADVGRAVTGTNVGTNAVIVSVNDVGDTATLSVNNSGGAVSNPVVSSGNPVPDGAYNLTVVSNSADDAAATDVNYSQTIVSSESVFTVAPY